MTSYLILTPATGPGRDQEATRCLRDGFSLAAFLLPGLWLLWHRLWLLAVGAFLVEGIGFALIQKPGFWPAGLAILIAIRVLAAVEGRMSFIRMRLGAGWTETGLVSARNLSEAEEIHFASLPADEIEDIPPVRWDIPTASGNQAARGVPLGLIGYDGGRA